MNKTELIDAIAKESGLTKGDSGKALTAALDAISNEMANGGSVQLIGFGTFSTKERAARTGRNPQTGAAIEIAAATLPAFKPGKELKEKVNN
ncbi:HU family DNA-binding protein [Neptuniibacter sp. QD37_11]|uniref:HU family DNA-binding protein n=1 Tax=Neptuniibacter sp. QD37_11 TaxID=3398209 RepID=UPI0039F5BB23